MKRHLAVVILAAAIGTSPGFAQPFTGDTAALPGPNQLPEFGGRPLAEVLKSPINQEFIAEIDKLGSTRETAAQHFVDRGWQYLEAGEPKSAIKRFNQAWLLAPGLPAIYWGFGACSSELGVFDQAVHYMRKALEIDPKNAGLMVDCGRVYARQAFSSKASAQERQESADSAIGMYSQAVKLDPRLPEAYMQWGATLHLLGKNREALEKLNKAEELKPSIVNPRLKAGVEEGLSTESK